MLYEQNLPELNLPYAVWLRQAKLPNNPNPIQNVLKVVRRGCWLMVISVGDGEIRHKQMCMIDLRIT